VIVPSQFCLIDCPSRACRVSLGPGLRTASGARRRIGENGFVCLGWRGEFDGHGSERGGSKPPMFTRAHALENAEIVQDCPMAESRLRPLAAFRISVWNEQIGFDYHVLRRRKGLLDWSPKSPMTNCHRSSLYFLGEKAFKIRAAVESGRRRAWFKKVSGTDGRSTLRAVPATVPDP
jgi:hypothetical protein